MMYQTTLSFAFTTCLTYIQIICTNPYSTLNFYYFLSYYSFTKLFICWFHTIKHFMSRCEV